MYSLKKSYSQVQKTYARCIYDVNKYVVGAGLGTSPFDSRNQHIYAAGVLNYMWQMWNSFWRTYWLAHVFGGEDIYSKKISVIPALPAMRNENQAIYYLLYRLGKRKHFLPTSTIKGSFEEPTWGDEKNIQNLCAIFFGTGTLVLSALSVYGQTIRHFQYTRNAAIHLDKDNMQRVFLHVLPHYPVSRISYPTEIIWAREASGLLIMRKWADELSAFLTYA